MPTGPDTDRQGAARPDRSGEWVWDEASKSRKRMHTEAEMEEQRAKAEADPDYIPSIGVTDYGLPYMGGATRQELDEGKPAGYYASKPTSDEDA